ncbi:hypothetical protein ACP4OV_001105 [Aristida adscensionis]
MEIHPESAEGASSLRALPFYGEALPLDEEELKEQGLSEAIFTVPSTPKRSYSRRADKKQMEANFQAYLVVWRETARERLTKFAERMEAVRKRGFEPLPPRLEIVHHPGSSGESMGIRKDTAIHSRESLVFIQEIPPAIFHAQDYSCNSSSEGNFSPWLSKSGTHLRQCVPSSSSGCVSMTGCGLPIDESAGDWKAIKRALSV